MDLNHHNWLTWIYIIDWLESTHTVDLDQHNFVIHIWSASLKRREFVIHIWSVCLKRREFVFHICSFSLKRGGVLSFVILDARESCPTCGDHDADTHHVCRNRTKKKKIDLKSKMRHPCVDSDAGILSDFYGKLETRHWVSLFEILNVGFRVFHENLLAWGKRGMLCTHEWNHVARAASVLYKRTVMLRL